MIYATSLIVKENTENAIRGVPICKKICFLDGYIL